MTPAEHEIRSVHEAAITRLQRIRQTFEALREEERQTYLHIKDCEAAGRVFGITFEPVETPEKQLPETGNVREFTTLYLNNSPCGVKSADILRAYKETFGRDLHPKTVGMTLYRLKKDGLAQIDGHIWRAAAVSRC